MKKRSCAFLLALCLLLTACGCDSGSAEPSTIPLTPAPESTTPAAEPSPEPTPELSQREKDWIEDIEFLRKEYKAQHMDPFYLRSEAESDWALDHLISQVGELSDNDIALEIVSFIAGMGDAHSFAFPAAPLFERRFPAAARYYDGKLYLTACLEGFEQLKPYLLHEIVAVNGVDIAHFNQKANGIANSFNSWNSRQTAASHYFLPAFFDWAGCDYTEGYTFQILNDNREVELVEMPVVTSGEYSAGKWIYPENWKNRRVGNYAEYVDGENGGYVYMTVDQPLPGAKYSFKRLAETVGELLAGHPDCTKLAVDLRGNPGGDASMVEPLRENAQLMEAEHVYVLTDGGSCSASITFLAFFKNELGSAIVGEPTGQFTSFFHMSSSEYEPLVLPHSQILVYLSDTWHDGDPIVEEYCDENGRLYGWENTILPDVYVYQDVEDVRQGKDSVLEWVLAQ